MNRIGHIIVCLAVTCSFIACSSGWLDTEPTDQTGTPTVFETTEMAKTAVNGLAKLMTIPFPYYVGDKLSSQDFNGEGAIKLIYGNWMGNHFVFTNRDAYAPLFKGTNYMGNVTSIYCYYPWWYYYMVIGNANTIVVNIDAATGPESEKQFIKAQALTFRSYCYMMLAQLYCNRWVDSNEGAASGVVLRLDTSTDEKGLCTMKELYKQIYDDLDEAIRCYTLSGLSRSKDDNYSPDLSVAYAVYARASLNRQDYATALSMASKAREGYPLMDNKAYCAGFNEPTSEWIWSSYSSESESIGYFSYFSKMGYNTINTNYKTRAFCINRELFNQFPKTDIRCSLFLDGDGDYIYNKTETASAGYAPANSGLPASLDLYKKAYELHPEMPSDHYVFAYMQFKISSQDGVGRGHLNRFRSSEMLLIEAEANYFLNKPELAQKALIALNKDSGRDANYTCTLTGEELWEEIKRYRALELWGEGFDWFDMKRWNEPINRKTYPNGGNFTAQTAFITTVDENNRWTWSVPALETDYNGGIN